MNHLKQNQIKLEKVAKAMVKVVEKTTMNKVEITKEAKELQKEKRIKLTREVAEEYSVTQELARMIGGLNKDYSYEKQNSYN